jgi:cellulose 1,4-beta-cellobiosidase
MNSTTSTAPYALSLTITGTSGAITHTGSATLLVSLGAPASLTATANTAGQIALSWPASVSASSYHVKRSLLSGGPYVTVACTSGTSYTDSGLSNGVTYYYVVSAAYTANPDAGGESADSAEANATAQLQVVIPIAPTNVSASTGKQKGAVNVRWTQSVSAGITQNYIYRRISTGSYPSTPTAKISATTTYLDNKLTGGATYCYEVSAFNSAGESTKSLPEACARAK